MPSTRLTLLDRLRRRLHRGRRAAPPAAASNSTTGRQVSPVENTLSSASSLPNVSTISSSYVGDELDLDDWEDEPQEEEHYPDEDWLTADRSAAQLTVDRNSSAASSFRSGIHFTARACASPSSVGSGIQFTVRPSSVASGIQFSVGPATAASSFSSGIHFLTPQVIEPPHEEYAPNTLPEEYVKTLTLEDLKDDNSNCLTCGVSWRNEEASLDCNECGGYPLHRPCPECSGKCGATWDRDLTKSHDKALAAFSGVCLFQPDKGRCQHIAPAGTGSS